MITSSANETMDFAYELAKKTKAPKIIVLSGDLGAGKTTFTKGFAKGLGINEIITSPTFTLLNEYEGKEKMYHFDMYRINDESEAVEFGILDYFNDPKAIVVIEWYQNIAGLLPKHYIQININKIDDNKREFEFINK